MGWQVESQVLAHYTNIHFTNIFCILYKYTLYIIQIYAQDEYSIFDAKRLNYTKYI